LSNDDAERALVQHLERSGLCDRDHGFLTLRWSLLTRPIDLATAT
jgi:hypothetical protein